jgi:hypothetical protein
MITRGILARVLAIPAGALLFGLAGCSSGSTPSSTSTDTSTPPAASQPGWVQAIGSGLTVIPPGTASPGTGSPGAVVTGLVNVMDSGHLRDECDYFQPSIKAECTTAMKQLPASYKPTIKNFALGYVVIDGDKALVGITGTSCIPGQHPECSTNHNPAAIFTTGKSFAALLSAAIAASNSTSSAYSLTPCVKVGGHWYLDATV